MVDLGRTKIDASKLTPAQVDNTRRAYESLTLDLRPDNTFRIKMFLTVEGKWAVDRDTVTLTPKPGSLGLKLAGQTSPKFTVQEEGKTLALLVDGVPRLVLVRKP